MQLTTRVRLHTASQEPWLEVAIPRQFLAQAEALQLDGFASVTIERPKRPRSTGPKSQNNRSNGFIRQIAQATGNDFAAIEAACKLAALDEGYPIEEVCGHWVAKSQAALTIEECGRFIATIERIAAEQGIHLEED